MKQTELRNGIKFEKILLVLGLFLVCCACNRKVNNPSWETDLLVPLAKSSLSIEQLVSDSLKEVNADNSVNLIFSKKLSDFSIDSLITLPNSTFDNNTNIGSIGLDDRLVNYRISLGMIANNWPVWGPFVIANNGMINSLPNITAITSGPFTLNVNDVFEVATFQSGFMDFTIHNNFPVDIANVNFEIKNAIAGNVVVNETFAYIPAGTSQTKTVDLTGLTVEGLLDVSILNLDILGGNQNILIDTTDDLQVDLVLRSMKLQSATAVFPSQNLVDEKVSTSLLIDNIKLKEAKISSGSVLIESTSTIEDTIYFTYSIPGATLSGVPFLTEIVIPPAPPGGSVTRQFPYDFSNYELDLSGDLGNSANVIYSELTGRIDSTGKKITLSLADSLVIHVSTENLKPYYVRGFLGNDTLGESNQSESLDLFDVITDGSLEIEEVSAFISIDNYLGIDGNIRINELTARNDQTGNSVSLTGSHVASDISILAATDNPHISTHTELTLSNGNSNITSLINVLPNALDFDIQAYLNPGVDTLTTDFEDFAYDTNTLDVALNLSIPLSLIANNLTLKDTADFQMQSTQDLDQTVSGKLNFIVDNGFPLSSNIRIRFLDETYQVLDSLVSQSEILAGTPINGKIVTPRRTINTFDINNDRLNSISAASYVEFEVTFNSSSSTNFNKIYDDYSIDFVITADVKYEN